MYKIVNFINNFFKLNKFLKRIQMIESSDVLSSIQKSEPQKLNPDNHVDV